MEFEFSGRKRYLFFELLRQLTPQQRLLHTLKMTSWEIKRQREEIAKANPQFTEEEVNLKWVEQAYGKELAEGLHADLARRKLEKQS
jgi:hypothetical protein